MPNQSPKDIQKRTFDFSIRIVKMVDRLSHTLAGTEIGRQVLRSGTSIGANVQEADGAESKRDFIHKIGITRKEAQETRYWLGIIQAAILANDEVAALWKEADELARISFAIIKSARIRQFTQVLGTILSFGICSFVITQFLLAG